MMMGRRAGGRAAGDGRCGAPRACAPRSADASRTRPLLTRPLTHPSPPNSNITWLDALVLSLAELAGAFFGALLHFLHFYP